MSKALGSVGGSSGTSTAKTSVSALSTVADAAQSVSSPHARQGGTAEDRRTEVVPELSTGQVRILQTLYLMAGYLSVLVADSMIDQPGMSR